MCMSEIFEVPKLIMVSAEKLNNEVQKIGPANFVFSSDYPEIQTKAQEIDGIKAIYKLDHYLDSENEIHQVVGD